MSQYKPGSRLRSAVCTTEVVIIAAPVGDIRLSCGGAPLLAEGDVMPDGVTLDASAAAGTLMGKRYTDDAGKLELLCVKPGQGSLESGGVALVVKGAKPLPSSD
jgi:hypothetical protein